MGSSSSPVVVDPPLPPSAPLPPLPELPPPEPLVPPVPALESSSPPEPHPSTDSATAITSEDQRMRPAEHGSCHVARVTNARSRSRWLGPTCSSIPSQG